MAFAMAKEFGKNLQIKLKPINLRENITMTKRMDTVFLSGLREIYIKEIILMI